MPLDLPPSSGPPQVRLGDKPLLFAVDDEPSNLDLIIRALRDGYRVRTFDNALRAVAAARDERPVVVLTDYRMPQLSGAGLVRAFKDAKLSCVFLLVTAYSETEEVMREQQRANIFFRIIPKPWKAIDLRCQVDLAVGLYNLQARSGSNPPSAS